MLKCAYLTFQIQYLPYIVTPRHFKCNSKICLNRKFSRAVKIGSGQKREKEYVLHRSKQPHTQNHCQKLPVYFFSGTTSQINMQL